MNSDATIADRMMKAGLPYEITNAETPMFMLSGGSSVVAIWQDSVNDYERAFVGFLNGRNPEAIAQTAKRVRGVHTVYIVSGVESV